jgi:hypothetical protein
MSKTKARKIKFDQVGWIMQYESGELSDQDIITGFQHLIDNGMAWKLQGHYGRTASLLIEAGHCHAKGGK